jgi:hypothetical protein
MEKTKERRKQETDMTCRIWLSHLIAIGHPTHCATDLGERFSSGGSER